MIIDNITNNKVKTTKLFLSVSNADQKLYYCAFINTISMAMVIIGFICIRKH